VSEKRHWNQSRFWYDPYYMYILYMEEFNVGKGLKHENRYAVIVYISVSHHGSALLIELVGFNNSQNNICGYSLLVSCAQTQA
jgi:hypothetical protein